MVSSSLTNGARRKHRGPQPGHKKSLAKQSNQRREHLFDAPAVPDGVVHALPTEASRDHRTEEEISAVLPWVSRSPFCRRGSRCTTSDHLFQADRIVERYPYTPPGDRVPGRLAPVLRSAAQVITNLVCISQPLQTWVTASL
jgi:hypothetical protein